MVLYIGTSTNYANLIIRLLSQNFNGATKRLPHYFFFCLRTVYFCTDFGCLIKIFSKNLFISDIYSIFVTKLRTNMKRKVILNEKEICQNYVTTNIGVETLALKHHVGKKRIKEILLNNGIEIKKRGKQPLHDELVINWREQKYKPIDGSHYVVYDPKTEFTTTDIDNKSGVLTTYIEQTYTVKTPTLYDRRKYYMRTGNYWWEQWLSVRVEKNKPTKKCPYCGWETEDINNKSGAFEQHLLKVHSKTKLEYLSDYPADKCYFIGANPQANLQFETNQDEYVTCKVCGRRLRRIDSHHLKIHGMTKKEYLLNYGTSNISSVNYAEKQRQATIKTNMSAKFTRQSKPELEIISILKSVGLECSPNRKVLHGQEIDIYVPSLKFGIEYDGLFYHTEGRGKHRYYHLNKTDNCLKNGVKLIHIFEDEYINKHDIVVSKLLHMVGKNNGERIYARKCTIKPVSHNEANSFLEKNHIQGKCGFTVAYGLFYQNTLVSVMLFLRESTVQWNLVRFASDIEKICIGAGGKLFKHFINSHNPSYVKTFADRRWTIDSTDNLYTKLGFKVDDVLKPDYRYYNRKVDKLKRFHKFNFRKQILHKKYGLPLELTELEMTRKLGYDRIWDCGLIKYVYVNSK